MARKTKLISLLAICFLLAPFIAYAGGGIEPQQSTPIEVHVNLDKTDRWLTSDVVAAAVAGIFGVAGAIVGVRGHRDKARARKKNGN